MTTSYVPTDAPRNRDGSPVVTINAPEDPGLATLWNLAMTKFETAAGRPPETRAEFRAVSEEYHRLLGKERGSIAHVIREVCERAPGGD